MRTPTKSAKIHTPEPRQPSGIQRCSRCNAILARGVAWPMEDVVFMKDGASVACNYTPEQLAGVRLCGKKESK